MTTAGSKKRKPAQCTLKRRQPVKQKTKLDTLSQSLAAKGWETTLSERSLLNIIGARFTGKNLPLAVVAAEIAFQQNPLTLRGEMYQIVSAGWLPSTDQKHYHRTGRLMTKLREKGIVPFEWIVDNVRETMKPSSWAGISDYVQTVQYCYRAEVTDQWDNYVAGYREQAEDLKRRVDEVAEAFTPRLEALAEEYETAIGPLRDQAEELEAAIEHTVGNCDLEIDLPPRPVANVTPPDELNWLYSSSRTFEEQLRYYQRHKGMK